MSVLPLTSGRPSQLVTATGYGGSGSGDVPGSNLFMVRKQLYEYCRRLSLGVESTRTAQRMLVAVFNDSECQHKEHEHVRISPLLFPLLPVARACVLFTYVFCVCVRVLEFIELSIMDKLFSIPRCSSSSL